MNMCYAIIELALHDFGMSLNTYINTNYHTLERVTDHLIGLSSDIYKEQLVISQSIILENIVDRRMGTKRKVTFNV